MRLVQNLSQKKNAKPEDSHPVYSKFYSIYESYLNLTLNNKDTLFFLVCQIFLYNHAVCWLNKKQKPDNISAKQKRISILYPINPICSARSLGPPCNADFIRKRLIKLIEGGS